MLMFYWSILAIDWERNLGMTGQQEILERSAQEAWDAVNSDDNAYIIDVRTDIEWSQVGAPDLGALSSKLHFISWQLPPDTRVNAAFLEELAATQIPQNGKLYFLCRSGVRSLAAARLAAEAGYETPINVAAGFEGIAGPDGKRHGGWVGAGLSSARFSR